jgi:hypothetical protein
VARVLRSRPGPASTLSRGPSRLVTQAPACLYSRLMAKGIEKDKTQNKPKLSTKEKQKRKKEKKANRAAG